MPLILSKAYSRVVFSTLRGLGNLEYGVGNLTVIKIHILLILEKFFSTLVIVCSMKAFRALFATHVSMWHQAKKVPNQTVDF